MDRPLSLYLLLIIYAICGTSINLDAQIYFQYEQAESIDVKRWSAGDKILFRQNRFGNEWVSERIVEILPESNSMLLQDQILHLDDITYIRYNRPLPNTIGKTLTYFGVSWLTMGGLIEGLAEINAIETQYRFGVDTAIIGASSILTGYLTQKLWSKATKKLNKRRRVRIIDLRF